MAEWNKERYQEIANRGLQDQLSPERKARFDEAVKRGLITTKEQPGMLESIGNMFTGADRETRATQELPELESAIVGGDASGFLSTLPTGDAVKLAGAIATTSDPAERAKMLQAASPDFGIQYDEKGNIIAANNATGQRVVLNKPGLSASDLFPMSGRVAASIPLASTGGTPLVAGAAMGAKEGTITAAQEGFQASQGGDFDVGNVIADMALGGLSEFIPSFIGKMKGKTGAKADELAEEAIQAEAGRIANPASVEAQQAKSNALAAEIAKQGQKRRRNLTESAGEVMINKDALDAAKYFDVDEDLTPGMLSDNPIYKDLEGALRAPGGNEISAKAEKGIAKVAQKADDIITELGGDLDKAALSDSIKGEITDTIGSLKKSSDKAYDDVNRLVPPQTDVDMSDLYVYLMDQKDIMRGNLEPVEKSLLNLAENPQGVSYALLDKERKKIGASLGGAMNSPYASSEAATLSKLYDMLTDAQGKNLSGEALERWETGKSLVSKRKDLEEASQRLFGKKLTDSLATKTGQAVKNIENFKNFDEIMAAIPEKAQREKLLVSSLNDVFTTRSGKEQKLNIPGFVDWYGNVKRQPALMKRLNDNLPKGAIERLDKLYTLTKQIRDANSRVVKTGVAKKTLEGLDKYEGMLSSIYNTGKKAAAAEGVTSSMGLTGVGSASVIADALNKGSKDSATVAADKLIASPEFKRMAIKLAENNFKANKASKAAEKALRKSERYKKWYSMLPSEDKMRIIRGGLISYLGGEDQQ